MTRLEISSARVQSVSPDYCDVRSGDMRDSDTPVWVIGGGKTAMDTAHTLITHYPGREVNLVAGRGTFFTTRDRLFATGSRRWWAVCLAPKPRCKWAVDLTELTRPKFPDGIARPMATS